MTPAGQRATAGWLVQYPLGGVDAMRAMGTVAAPTLGGFSLATLAFLLTSDKPIRNGDVAVAAFAVAAALLVFALQFTSAGLLYSAPPADRLAWVPPERAGDLDTMGRLHRVQHQDVHLQQRYFFRARLTYDLGILSLLGGLLLLVAPAHWWSWRGCAFVVVAAAVVLEGWWIVGGRLGQRPGWLTPGYRDIEQTDPAGSSESN